MRSGNFIFDGENRKVFVPNDLPPDPKLHIDTEMRALLSEAEKSLYRLEGTLHSADAFPDIIRSVITYEAVNSLALGESELAFEKYYSASAAGDGKSTEATENLVSAIDLGLSLLKNVGSSSHIFKSVHSQLSGTGEYRDKQSAFGKSGIPGTAFLPPPPENIPGLMLALEKYISTDLSYPALINAALIHAQFEMIHPFETGNGTLGRILILLHLKWKKILPVPAIASSAFIRSHSAEYYDRLAEIETSGEWEAWIKYFLRMVGGAAKQTGTIIARLLKLNNDLLEIIINRKFVTPAAVELMRLIFRNPVITLPFITENLRFTKQTANTTVAKFVEEKILFEKTGQMRNRVFVFNDFFDAFAESSKH